MAFLTAWLFLALAGAAASLPDPAWDQFKAKYKKTYVSDADEHERYALFKASQIRVDEFNALNGQASFGINEMADRFPEEKHWKGYKKPEGFIHKAPVMSFTDLRSPPSINWRLTRAVTPVKNQGQCGSCWAFSATEAIESQLILATGGKVDIALSPQQITSCAPDAPDAVEYPCRGCQGGFPEGAYMYLMNGPPGLASSFYIPYEQSLTNSTPTMSCPWEKVHEIGQSRRTGGFAQVAGYHYATPPCIQGECDSQNLTALAAALEKTPLSICVNAEKWSDYAGGVMTAAACGSMSAEAIDHCVMLVGFNAKVETPYWIVRNSWGSEWGDGGYIYLEMANNTCGLANGATIPELMLNQTEQEKAKAEVLREAMYQFAISAIAV